MVKTRVVFLASCPPTPLHNERLCSIEDSTNLEVHNIYWDRLDSKDVIPSHFKLPIDRYHKVSLVNPCNVVLRFFCTLLFLFSVCRFIKKLDVKLIHALQPDMLLVAYLISLLDPRIKIIFEMHDIPNPRYRRFEKIIYLLCGRRISATFVSSPLFDSEFLRKQNLLLKSTPIYYISNAPREWKFRKASKVQKDNDMTIGWIGTIRCTQQIDNLLKAVEQLNSESHSIRVLVAGTGGCDKWCSEASRKYPFFEYIGPYNYDDSYLKLLSKCDVVYAVYSMYLFSYRVHIARRFHEAILSRMPIIVEKRSHMATLIEKNKLFGELVDDKPVDIRRAILEIKTNLNVYDFSHYEEIEKEHRFETYEHLLIKKYVELCEEGLSQGCHSQVCAQ